MGIAERVAPALVLLLVATSAHAAPCAPTDEACGREAEQLFQDARTAMGRSDFATACPMLERSYALDPGNGTLLALALCHEGQNKLATSLAEYKEALAGAVKANRSDRVMLAESHVQDLERRVPRLRFALPTPEPAGLALVLDGAAVARADVLAGVPVDPGHHEIVATVPGKPPFRAPIDVKVGEPNTLTIPPFEGAPPPSPRSNGAKTAAFVTGGLTLATLGVGAVFGALTLDALARSKGFCEGTVCTQEGFDLNHEARRDQIVADVLFGAAAALGVTTVVLAIVAATVGRPRAISASGAGFSVSF
jgi:hypothetical protein